MIKEQAERRHKHSLKREKLVETHISLRNDPTINSDTGFDFNTYILMRKISI